MDLMTSAADEDDLPPAARPEQPNRHTPQDAAIFYAACEVTRLLGESLADTERLYGKRGVRRDILLRSHKAARVLCRYLQPLAGIR